MNGMDEFNIYSNLLIEINQKVTSLGGISLGGIASFHNIYLIKGVKVMIYPSNQVAGEFEFNICGDDDITIKNSEQTVSSIEEIFERLPSKEIYMEMKKRHVYDRKVEIYGNIETANDAYNNELNMLKNALQKLKIKFISENEYKYWLCEIPVEFDALHPWLTMGDDPKYICYVIDSVGHRTDISYTGGLAKIINNLLTFDEYNALYGADCKSAGLKK